MTEHSEAELDSMAGEILELIQLGSAVRARRSASDNELTETEFVTLSLLAREQTLTIGEVQKHVGVVPAQMSRIIRSLEENRGKGYVHCEINPQDRRRVDVSLTSSGKEAYARYREDRLSSIREVLVDLPADDRHQYMRILRLIRGKLVARISATGAE